jgi:hypothetical protein
MPILENDIVIPGYALELIFVRFDFFIDLLTIMVVSLVMVVQTMLICALVILVGKLPTGCLFVEEVNVHCVNVAGFPLQNQ